MTNPDQTPDATPTTPTDDPAAMFLKPAEAKILLDWAQDEERLATSAAGTARVRAIVKEIDDLVGHRVDLVADDLEERMIALLVGDLDPKSQINLEISRDVAQVTAEKDHLEEVELVRRLTEISSHTLRLTAVTASPAAASAPPAALAAISTSPAPAAAASAEAALFTVTSAAAPATAPAFPNPNPADSATVSPPVVTRARPIPRPTKYPPRKPSLLQRLLGRK